MSADALSEVGAFQLRSVLDSIPARVALIGRDRRHLYVNQEYARFLGREPEAVLGRTVAEIIGAAAFETVRPFGDRALDGETARWEGWLPYTGERRFVQRVYMPYRNESGAIDGYFVFARDLTSLKEGETQLAEQLAALQASEALSGAITASALDCIVAIDDDGRVVEFNPAAERTFGYRKRDVVGQPISDLIVPPAMRARHADGFSRFLKTGEAKLLGRRVEMEAMRSGGEVFPVELTITEVRMPGRRLFTAYLRDLTEIRNAEAELQRSRDALHQSEKMAAFGSLLAGVAHELNNPLSIVIGNALMLHEEALENEAAGYAGRAEKIQTAAERCAKIVRTFLAMARQRTTEMRPVDAGELIRTALDLLAYGLRTHGVEVTLDLPSAPVFVLGDPDQLNQVLTNLLVNAQQELEKRPAPRLVCIGAEEAGEHVIVSVADNGPGVSQPIRGRIFDPFFTTKPAGAGTGIGLAVSRGIAEAHGGSLTLVDQPGGGACFELRLRRASPQAADPAKGQPEHCQASHECTALIVDDEAEVARVLAQMLERLSFRCDTASSGRQAQEALLRRNYDALLCDLHMPDVDGPALFGWLQANRPHLCNQTAFVTGDTLGEYAGQFLARVQRPVLEKPFIPEEVRRVVEALSIPARGGASP